jgi:hypothetical protein
MEDLISTLKCGVKEFVWPKPGCLTFIGDALPKKLLSNEVYSTYLTRSAICAVMTENE